ncbi:MAG: asparagine synthase (glutamine-hydrolyzing) [Clostridia bacterium]|nr:asparagine synthase (glutamine-hydrolyzing) [Clostridia bacterium]
MCGISGVTLFNKKLKKNKFIKSVRLLEHRGPDREGFFYSQNIAFGHKRLAVVDIENGIQPMSYKNFTIVYNGELYNTEDIRKELIKLGVTFTGHSDTEVLLKAYAVWKEKCIKKLNGIFAFAVWDGKKLFMCRDRVGVKPLYYYIKDNDLFFASELKTIINYYNLNEITINSLQEVLGLGPSHTSGEGIFKGVKELKPGSYMFFDGKEKIVKYWKLKTKKNKNSFEKNVAITKELFTDAVKRQLVSDVPLCTLLSGGVDSSAITAIACQNNDNFTSYSIDYENNDVEFKKNDFQVSSDKDYIKYMTSNQNLKHNYLEITLEELAEYLEKAVIARDLPGMADIDSSLLWFCTEIKKHHTVALSGEGADEIFGGYPWFYRDIQSNTFPWLRDLKERTKLLNEKWQKKLNLEAFVKDKYVSSLKELKGKTSEHQKLMYLNINWFMQALLDRKDRMSMMASLEVRVPFADHRLIEFLWNVPWGHKFYENREKGLLREALKGLVPEEILYRKKNPYPKTHSKKYVEIVKKLLLKALENKVSILHKIFDQKALMELIQTNGESYTRPWFGQLMTGPQLIAFLYQFDYWFRHYNIKIVE